ncbi:probable G-protein coupled receptor 139 [Gigantopelta aegis]|uniref:probable G-protein coupled receptor 139 n=1 Tax=Gigantopelta aegis TaxID=1735272 RepID=UPI001B88C558|nr:probable G-protein coupled receptor 139 [Gigantopelta aegis]
MMDRLFIVSSDELGTLDQNPTMSNSTAYVTDPDAVLIWRTIPPVLLCCGTVGSVLSLVVLTQKSMKRSPMTSYLTTLAVIDIMVLYTGLLRHWLKYFFDIEIRSLNIFFCKVHPWLVYLTLDMSAWLLVCMTLERVVSVWKPHRVKTICTSTASHISIVVVVVFLLGINSHFVYGKELIDVVKDNVTSKKCTQTDEHYRHFLYDIFPWIDLCIYCLIPFSIQIVGNCLIIGKIVLNARRMSAVMKNQNEKENRKRQVSSMTVMLLTLNAVFLLCTSPVSVYIIYIGYWKLQNINYQSRSTDLMWVLSICLMYFNNSFNFLFYCLSGKRFRSELKHVFRGLPTSSSKPDTFTLSHAESTPQIGRTPTDKNTNETYITRF